MARMRGRKTRLEEMKIRRSPRLQRTLPPPENKKHHSDKKAKWGRRTARSKLNREVSNTSSSLAIEIQVPVSTQPISNRTNEDEKAKPQSESNDKANTAPGRELKTPNEEKVAPATESKGFLQFQHPKYEGCMWIKGSLVPPYSGVRKWKCLDDAEIEPQFDQYETQIWEWASEYAVELGNVENEISDQEKQLIMDSLGNYCVFRNWDAFIEGLSPKKDTPGNLVPKSPHSPVLNSPEIKKEDTLDFRVESHPDISDVPMDDIPDVKSDSVPDETKKEVLDEPIANSLEVKMESPTDALPTRILNAQPENPGENPTANSSNAFPSSLPNTPPPSTPERPIAQDASPSRAPKKKLTIPLDLPILLVECLLSKCLYENIIQDPFYYLVKAEDKEINSVPTTFGREFYNIWQKLMRASRVKAQRVRMEMTQLLNGFDLWDQCHDISIGAQSRTLRKLAVERLITSLLDPSSALNSLLRPLDDTKQKEMRFKRLLHIFREAAEIAIWMYTQESYFRFIDDVAKLGYFDGQITGREECLELGYKEVEDTMRPHRFTRRDYPEGVLNGRPPVLMTKPVIRRVFVDSWTSCALNDRPGKVVSRAVVLLGKDEPLDKHRTKW